MKISSIFSKNSLWLVIITTLVSFNPSSANSQVLNIKQRYQQMSQWCWAAVSAASLEVYIRNKITGLEITQNEIVIHATGGLHNAPNYLVGGWNTCTVHGTGTKVSCLSVDWIINNFIYANSNQTEAMSFRTVNGPVTFSTIQSELAAGRPIFLAVTWTAGGGHVVIAYGLSGTKLMLMDPNTGPILIEYSSFVNNSRFKWVQTMMFNRSIPLKPTNFALTPTPAATATATASRTPTRVPSATPTIAPTATRTPPPSIPTSLPTATSTPIVVYTVTRIPTPRPTAMVTTTKTPFPIASTKPTAITTATKTPITIATRPAIGTAQATITATPFGTQAPQTTATVTPLTTGTPTSKPETEKIVDGFQLQGKIVFAKSALIGKRLNTVIPTKIKIRIRSLDSGSTIKKLLVKSEGAFTINDLPESYIISVQAKGFGTISKSIVHSESTHVKKFKLKPFR